MRKVTRIIVLLIVFSLLMGYSKRDERNTNYYINRPPLVQKSFIQLPIGVIKPRGWLYKQCRLAADGMTGHLDTLYPEVMGPRNGWLGGNGDGWERGPYWIDGLVPLAYILDDQELIKKAKKWIDWSLNSQKPSGYFGPEPFEEKPEPEPGLQKTNREDWWPHMIMLKALQSYFSATGDERVIELMTKYFHYQLRTLPEKPLDHWTIWAKNRGGENLSSIYWLYNRTGDKFLLDLAQILHKQTTPWTDLFLNGDLIIKSNSLWKSEWFCIHGVNLAMAIKEPAIYYQQAKEEKYLKASKKAFKDLNEFYGQPQGMFGNDELLHGTGATQGTELCTIVELMFSLENLIQITGDIEYADHLEKVAYNALPTHIKDDFSVRQYYQLPNQIIINRTNRNFITPHSGTDICYGLLTGYPCCTCNLHQGWPKFVRNLWYATSDSGSAALVYAPSEVSMKVGDEVKVHWKENTEYPFDDRIVLVFSSEEPVKFPLYLRIPGWCMEGVISINGKIWSTQEGNQIVKIDRQWRDGDRVELKLPMEVQTSRWFENSVSVEMGPLVYSLRIRGNWQKVNGSDKYGSYYEVYPLESWNYGIIDEAVKEPKKYFRIIKNEFSELYPWNIDNAPIQIEVMGKKIPEWKEYNEVAGPLPHSPIHSDQPLDKIILIPYGCSTLRISEFPVVR